MPEMDALLLRKIGKALKHLRQLQGESVDKVTEATGIDILSVEAGEVDCMIGDLCLICGYYGLSLSAFFVRVEKGGGTQPLH